MYNAYINWYVEFKTESEYLAIKIRFIDHYEAVLYLHFK